MRIGKVRLIGSVCILAITGTLIARAQQAIVLQPGDSLKIKAGTVPPRVDTVYRDRCFNAAMQQIPCPTQPQPPVDSSSHEPAGMTRVTERRFDALVENGWTSEWPKPSQYTISSDNAAPKSPTNVGQFLYPKGWPDGSAPADLYYTIQSACRTLYVSTWFKYSSNYYGNGSQVNKIYFYVIGGQPAIVPEAFGAGMNPLKSYIVVQNVLGQGNYGPNLAPNDSISRGVWHRLETVTTPSTLDWWLDGKPQGKVTGKNFGGTNYTQLRLSPNYGGFGENNVPYDQYLWVDHVYASCKAT